MKTTLEIPEDMFRQAKARAAIRGQTLKSFFTEALAAKLAEQKTVSAQPWMKHFGALRHLGKERNVIEKRIETEFETVEGSEWK